MKYLFQLDTLITCLLVFGVAWGLFYVPTNFDFFSPLKQAIGDFDITDMAQSKFRDEERNTVDTTIVLVNIGSLQRDKIGAMLERISREHPKVIGIDAMFRREKTAELDTPLARAISGAGNVIMGLDLQYNDSSNSFTAIESSHPTFSGKAAGWGFVNFITDEEKAFRTVREFSPSEKVGDSTVLGFPVAIAQKYNADAVRELLTRENNTEVINFRGNYSSFYAFDTDQILDSSADLSVMNNTIVLMGYLGEHMDTTVVSLEDVFFTPMNKRYAGKTFPDMYGVVVHANVISQILHKNYINVMPTMLTAILSIVVCLLNIAIFNAFEERNSKWYDTFTIVSILLQSIFCTFAIVFVFHNYEYKMNLTLTLATLALTPTMHEIYHNTIKPLVLEGWARLRRRGTKRTAPPIPTTDAESAVAQQEQPSTTPPTMMIILLLLILSPLFIQAQEMKVLSVRGKVNIIKGKAVRTGMKLSSNDKINVGDKSSITLLYNKGRSIDINKPGTYSISDVMAQAAKGGSGFSSKFANYVYNELTETSDDPNADTHKKNMGTTGSVERAGGDRQRNVDALTEILQTAGLAEEGQHLNEGVANTVESVLEDNTLTAIMPRSSYLLEPALTFSWFKNGNAQSYILVLIDAAGNTALRKTVNDTTCRIDMTAEKLERGKNYYWKVLRADKESVRSTEYCLQLLPEAEAQAKRDTLNGIESELGKSAFANIVKAQFAEDAGLHIDAVRNYNDAVSTSGNEDYKRYYRNYLRRLNLYDAAKKVK